MKKHKEQFSIPAVFIAVLLIDFIIFIPPHLQWNDKAYLNPIPKIDFIKSISFSSSHIAIHIKTIIPFLISVVDRFFCIFWN